MNNSDESSASEIVRIAYRQSQSISSDNDIEDPLKSSNKEVFACTDRITNLPIVASINASISGAYSSVKTSHSTVETILNQTEETLAEGVKIVSPVTSKIGETLEEPLKSIDNVICNGLDYLEEKVPAVKLPPGEIYDNFEGYVRDVSDTVKKHSRELYADVKVRLEDLGKVVQGHKGETDEAKRDGKTRN